MTGRSTAPGDRQPKGIRIEARQLASDRVDAPTRGRDDLLERRGHHPADHLGRVAAVEEPGDADADETEERGPSESPIVHPDVVAGLPYVGLRSRVPTTIARVLVYLCRHAEAAARRSRRAARADRRPGRRQARELGERLAALAEPPVAVLASPLRARAADGRGDRATRPAPHSDSSRGSRRARRSTSSARRSRVRRARSPPSGTSPTARRSRSRSPGATPGSHPAGGCPVELSPD